MNLSSPNSVHHRPNKSKNKYKYLSLDCIPGRCVCVVQLRPKKKKKIESFVVYIHFLLAPNFVGKETKNFRSALLIIQKPATKKVGAILKTISSLTPS